MFLTILPTLYAVLGLYLFVGLLLMAAVLLLQSDAAAVRKTLRAAAYEASPEHPRLAAVLFVLLAAVAWPMVIHFDRE